MAKRITSVDVARLAGVSQSTVSRVLSGRDDLHIGEETRQAVLDAAHALGYRKNLIAESLVSGRTRMALFAVPYIHRPFYSQILHRLQRICRDRGYGAIITDTRGDDEQPSAFDLAQALRWPVDGMIIVDTPFDLAQAGREMPIVNVGLPSRHADTVILDMGAGAVLAVEHLVSVGARRIVFATPSFVAQPTEQRHAGYERVMKRHGLRPEIMPIPVHSRASAHAALTEYVQRNGAPDAVFCYEDNIAIGVHAALHDLGVDIPGQTAVVGFDGIEDTEYVRPALTTVLQPVDQLCAVAWEMLERRIADTSSPILSETLTPKLAIRGSSSPHAIPTEHDQTGGNR